MNLYRWPDIHLGLAHSFEAVFTEQMTKNFAELSGDINPLHVDAEYAAAAGFASPVIFGLMSSALYSQLAGVYLPGKYALLQGIDLDFNAPCFVGEVLTVKGEVTFMTEAYHRFEAKASIRKKDGKLVSKATLRIGFHGE
ncbi:MaoC/PaaZ C-terminal domain-containing protein [Granulicella tundricola]|uniref:MaoC domain protein dehydratase n=1 Tax=Granulicella tundricola (strain ATCC BAA-1859 / DSM 23138 / MP5ACTX9) TaxID=1198114 RepID=E8WY20_GRATM|nr:MaoC/PaaZ C-terminal domain-containing protein [Granulicella tundricola]ADW67559.1 MaoC domain protein dehydratase [Granulicella tundricola MP5ACTX9]